MGRGQPGSPQELSASGIKQARGNGLSINVSINCGEAFVYYPFQLSGLAEQTTIIAQGFQQPLQFCSR